MPSEPNASLGAKLEHWEQSLARASIEWTLGSDCKSSKVAIPEWMLPEDCDISENESQGRFILHDELALWIKPMKMVVFSQFRKMLLRAESALNHAQLAVAKDRVLCSQRDTDAGIELFVSEDGTAAPLATPESVNSVLEPVLAKWLLLPASHTLPSPSQDSSHGLLSNLSRLQADMSACASIQHRRLDGTMSGIKRKLQLDEFKSGPSIPVMLVSTKAGGVGLNITEASVAILLDPWWNNPVEEQAVNRVHRLGQKRAVTVKRFIACGTVEESMLQIQARKQRVADEALEASGASDRPRLTADDLIALFRGGI